MAKPGPGIAHRLMEVVWREFSLTAETQRWAKAARILGHLLRPDRVAPPRPCRCWFCRTSGPSSSPPQRVLAVHETRGGRLVYDRSGAFGGFTDLATGVTRIFGPPPAVQGTVRAMSGPAEFAVSKTPGHWVVYDTAGEICGWFDLVPYRRDASGHLAPCPVIATELPPWAREVTGALAAVNLWRDRLPPWPADELIDAAAHQLWTRPVPDNPEVCAAGCSCGSWGSLVVTTEDEQQTRFDGHMISLQVAARAARADGTETFMEET